MKIEDYFDFLAEDDIRVKGTRVGIESILYQHIYQNKTAEEIAGSFPSLKSEQVYATILYYLQNRESIEAYLLDWMNFSKEMREKQSHNPSPIVLRLQKLKAERSLISA